MFKISENKLLVISIILFFIFGYIVALSVVSFKQLEEKTPFVKEKIDSGEFAYAYNFYLNENPSIASRPAYGNPNASVTMLAFLDIDSETSKKFIMDIFPKLKQDFIDTGKIKYYHKNYITSEDYKVKNNRYIYATTLSCIKMLKEDSYYDVYFELFKNSSNISSVVSKYNVSVDNFTYCLQNNEFDEIKEDMSEVENFGIPFGQKFYIGYTANYNTGLDGIPSYTTFRRTINEYQMRIGG
jgi:hypothetical protein